MTEKKQGEWAKWVLVIMFGVAVIGGVVGKMLDPASDDSKQFARDQAMRLLSVKQGMCDAGSKTACDEADKIKQQWGLR